MMGQLGRGGENNAGSGTCPATRRCSGVEARYQLDELASVSGANDRSSREHFATFLLRQGREYGSSPDPERAKALADTPAVQQRVHQRPRVRAAAAQLARRRSPSRRCLLSGLSLSPVLLENRGSQSR
jgi:hypothetical protein